MKQTATQSGKPLLGNLLTKRQALELVPFKASKFSELVSGGAIRTVRIGRRAYYHRDELEEDLVELSRRGTRELRRRPIHHLE